jgi:hypothetical protein
LPKDIITQYFFKLKFPRFHIKHLPPADASRTLKAIIKKLTNNKTVDPHAKFPYTYILQGTEDRACDCFGTMPCQNIQEARIILCLPDKQDIRKVEMDTDALFNLRKFLVPEIVYGEDALELAGRHAVNFGATRVLVVTDPGVQKAGWVTKVESSLKSSGISHITFSDVTPNPKDYEVMKGAGIYNAEKCDLIIAVGGGSPMDCAKGIGVVAGNTGHILDFEGVDEVPTRDLLLFLFPRQQDHLRMCPSFPLSLIRPARLRSLS